MIVPKFHFIQHLIALSGDPHPGLTIVLVVFGIVGLIHFVFKKIPKLSPKQRKKFERIYFSFLGSFLSSWASQWRPKKHL